MSSETRGAATGLMLLRCPECGNGLSGLQTDCIFLCTSCGACWLAGEGLTRIPLAHSPCSAPGAFPMPFWKVEATVTVPRRIRRSAWSTGTLEGPRLFDGTERNLVESSLPAVLSTFVFPAFSTGQVLRAGVVLHGVDLPTVAPESGSIAPMVGGSVGPEDVEPLARGVAVGVQVAAGDSLAMLEIELAVRSASILAVGCLRVGSHLRFAEGRLTIPVAAVTDWEAIRLGRSAERTDLTGTRPPASS